MVMVNEPSGVEATHLRIAELVQGLHGRPEADSDTVIAELAEHAAAVPVLLDEIQQRYQEGPCLTAAWEEKIIHVADLEIDDRFPSYRRDVLAETPIRTIMSFQLFIADETMGALNVYAERPNVFVPESKTMGLIFAAHSSVAWNSARREEQFKKALASRDIIGQAKGMIMERYGVDAVQAFELLRKLSQDSNVPLQQVASDLVSNSRLADR
jgi:GAF domain-containing protein